VIFVIFGDFFAFSPSHIHTFNTGLLSLPSCRWWLSRMLGQQIPLIYWPSIGRKGGYPNTPDVASGSHIHHWRVGRRRSSCQWWWAVFVDPAFVIIIIGREREQNRIFCDGEDRQSAGIGHSSKLIQNSCLVRLFVTKELSLKKIGSSVFYLSLIMSRCEQVCLSLFSVGHPPIILWIISWNTWV